MNPFKKQNKLIDNVGPNDIEQLKKNQAWKYLVEQWETDANALNILLLTAPLKEVRDAKGRLIIPSVDNIRGQLDNLLAVLTSAKVLDEAIQADIQITRSLKPQPGGQEDET